jgi:hypothetical protein
MTQYSNAIFSSVEFETKVLVVNFLVLGVVLCMTKFVFSLTDQQNNINKQVIQVLQLKIIRQKMIRYACKISPIRAKLRLKYLLKRESGRFPITNYWMHIESSFLLVRSGHLDRHFLRLPDHQLPPQVVILRQLFLQLWHPHLR